MTGVQTCALPILRTSPQEIWTKAHRTGLWRSVRVLLSRKTAGLSLSLTPAGLRASCVDEVPGKAHREGSKKRGRMIPDPLQRHLFRKHFAQLDETSLKHIDLCHILLSIDLVDSESAVAGLKQDADCSVFRIYNPIFLNPGLLI